METLKTSKWTLYQQKFLQKDIEEITDRATRLLDILINLPEYDRKDRAGGVLVLVPDKTCASSIAIALGKVPENDPEEYYEVALRKCLILREKKDSHSSYVLRDKSKGIYGGGISFKWLFPAYHFATKAYIAFSGLPEYGDEALVLVLAIDMHWISEDQARKISEASDNPYFEPLLKASRK